MSSLKVRNRMANKRIENEAVDKLFDAVLALKTKEECYGFFEDLCTINEILDMSQRIEVASLLRKKCVYQEITKKTGASTATISRINRSLNYGNDAYNLILDRIED